MGEAAGKGEGGDSGRVSEEHREGQRGRSHVQVRRGGCWRRAGAGSQRALLTTLAALEILNMLGDHQQVVGWEWRDLAHVLRGSFFLLRGERPRENREWKQGIRVTICVSVPVKGISFRLPVNASSACWKWNFDLTLRLLSKKLHSPSVCIRMAVWTVHLAFSIACQDHCPVYSRDYVQMTR